MDCGMEFIKYVIFIFNFVIALCGIAILVVAFGMKAEASSLAEVTDHSINGTVIAVLVIGAIVFTIAFFGCCGAIRENHCMIVTYGILLLTILIIQVAIGALAVYSLEKVDEKDTIKYFKNDMFNEYWTNKDKREDIDSFQAFAHCCGVETPKDYLTTENSFNNTIPWSCCKDAKMGDACSESQAYSKGCVPKILEKLRDVGSKLKIYALSIAAIEFVGVVFAFCLANAIKNADRRGYRV